MLLLSINLEQLYDGKLVRRMCFCPDAYVVSANFFNSYEELSFAIREELHELDFDAHYD